LIKELLRLTPLLVTGGDPVWNEPDGWPPDKTRLLVRFRNRLHLPLAGLDPCGKTTKINLKTEENFRLFKTWSLSTTISTRFTTLQPSKNHAQALRFSQNPLQKQRNTSQIKNFCTPHQPEPSNNFLNRVTISPRSPLYQVKAVLNTVLQKEIKS
jgi:hypothetical protein